MAFYEYIYEARNINDDDLLDENLVKNIASIVSDLHHVSIEDDLLFRSFGN
jgi:hypothetical protein